jgi:formylglycine-generating enzyme required for sulfatase activity
VPAPDTGRLLSAPDDVNRHPKAASPFGVTDLIGNVWQWTDEYQDEHTRAAIFLTTRSAKSSAATTASSIIEGERLRVDNVPVTYAGCPLGFL